MIVLPLTVEELALVRKALRALDFSGGDLQVWINIERAMDQCHVFKMSPRMATLIEKACFE